MSIGKTGWRYCREPRGNPPAACSSSTSQWPPSQWQTSWNSCGRLHKLRNVGDFGFLEGIPENRREGCGQDTLSQYTTVQCSLFTSAKRTARAWLKNDQAPELHCHLCAPEKSLVIWCVACLIHGCLTCLSPEHFIFLIHSSFYGTRTRSTIATRATSRTPSTSRTSPCSLSRQAAP